MAARALSHTMFGVDVNSSELKKLIELHAVELEAQRMRLDPEKSAASAASLKQMEISIIHGALDLWAKKVAEIMVPWNEVYKIPSKYACLCQHTW